MNIYQTSFYFIYWILFSFSNFIIKRKKSYNLTNRIIYRNNLKICLTSMLTAEIKYYYDEGYSSLNNSFIAIDPELKPLQNSYEQIEHVFSCIEEVYNFYFIEKNFNELK